MRRAVRPGEGLARDRERAHGRISMREAFADGVSQALMAAAGVERNEIPNRLNALIKPMA
jgi:hypothetical protein